MSTETTTIKVTIDNITIDVAPGTTILQAARMIGGDVTPPAMCYYSKLEGSGGKCRTCLVEVAAGSTADPRPMPKLVASCRTTVMDGMIVKNMTSEKVPDARAGVVEFLLLNHPLDCPICDQAGECHLQDLGYEHGNEKTRYEFKRRTFKKEDLGPYIQLHMTRCILCYRCTYVAAQLTDKRMHGVVDRGDHAAISTYIAKAIDNDFSGNMIDVCPVGALTDKTFRFKNRVWFTKPVDAHRNCTTPGCCGKATLWLRGEEVFRVTARKDEWGEVQSFDGKPGWICNICRFETKQTSAWTIEGLTTISRHSVLGANKYKTLEKPNETVRAVMNGVEPRLLMDIRSVSGVNQSDIHLSEIKGPAHSEDFKK
jgi:NADH-quinone oxidoreductase subunit G